MSKSPGLLPVALLQCLFVIRGLAAEKASVPEFVEESETLDNSTFVRARGQTTHGVTFTIQSEFVMVFMDQPVPVSINYSIDCSAVEDSYGILFDVPEQYVFKIIDKGPIFLHHTASSCKAHGSAHGEVFITLTGILPGRGSLLITVLPGVTSATINSTKSDGSLTYSPLAATIPSHGNLSSWAVPMNGSEQFPARFTVVCLKKPTQLDTVMQYVMMIYLVLLMLAMGCKTKVDVLKQVWRRPVAPAIGLFCQFVLMPLIAFGLTQVITFPTPGMALGFFACGCCPGGGASNLWTHLLGGDVSLSVALTTVSNLAAIGTFPLWIFTLGRIVLTDQTHLKIPYLNIVVSLLMIAIPLAVGCVINYKRPAFTKKLLKVFIPILVILTIGFISLVLYLNLYMFRLIKPILILAGALLPYIGYACAMALSILFRQSWSYCKTISIETGIQNAGIAFIMVMFSFPPPDNVIAGTAPMASSSMTPIPLMVVAAIYHIYLRCCAKKSSDTANSKDENYNTDDKENVTCPESKAMLEKVSSL